MRILPRNRFVRLLAALALMLLLTAPGTRAGDFVTLASTTSTQNAGLFEHLLPLFAADTGIEVRVVAVGTGQALRLARNGDADLLLVHDTAVRKRPSSPRATAASAST